MSKASYAAFKAYELHFGQVRKIGGLPYWTHPFKVAEIVSQHTKDKNTVAAAFLHDTIEDTSYTFKQMRADFGIHITNIVKQVTEDKSIKDWHDRKRKYVKNIRSKAAALIAVADKIDNLPDVYEPGFAVPAEEKIRFYYRVINRVEKYQLPITKELKAMLYDVQHKASR